MRIAVFGKPGGGKSTLSQKLAATTGLPLHPLDLMQYRPGGERLDDAAFEALHAQLLARADWIVDGFGNPAAFEAMLRAADVLVYVERPVWLHYWWVTKRLLKSPFSHPAGWPEGSPMWRSTLTSYRFLRRSPRFWNAALRERLLALRPGKRVHVIRGERDERVLLAGLRRDETRR